MDLILCFCDDDELIKQSLLAYKKANPNYVSISRGRTTAIVAQLTGKTYERIIVTAHGCEGQIGNAGAGVGDINAAAFAEILNKTGYKGQVYFDVCEGNKFAANVKKSCASGATFFGAPGATDVDIDLSKHIPV